MFRWLPRPVWGSAEQKVHGQEVQRITLFDSSLANGQAKQILDDTIESWMAEGKEHQIDDILVVGIRV